MRQHWRLYGLVLALWSLALVRVLIDPTPRLPVLFNVTPSLPYRIAIVQPGARDYGRGDVVVYAFAGDATQHYPGLRRQPFFKVIRGVAGDRVTVREQHAYVNGVDMGRVKPHTLDGRPLAPIADTIIPPGHYYVQGTGADSFDSRYAASGLVRTEQIIARVLPLF